MKTISSPFLHTKPHRTMFLALSFFRIRIHLLSIIHIKLSSIINYTNSDTSMNVRENRKEKHEWTIQEIWQHWIHRHRTKTIKIKTQHSNLKRLTFSVFICRAQVTVTRLTLGVRWAHGRTLPLILVEETVVPGENHRPDARNWQTII